MAQPHFLAFSALGEYFCKPSFLEEFLTFDTSSVTTFYLNWESELLSQS